MEDTTIRGLLLARRHLQVHCADSAPAAFFLCAFARSFGAMLTNAQGD